MLDPVLILQNGDDCPPGLLAEQITAAGMRYEVRQLFAGEPLPSRATHFSALVTLGGSMSALDDVQHPYVGAQTSLLREQVASGRPVLGICLGSQILARALGSAVRQSAEPEYFFTLLETPPQAPEDPLLGPPREWAPVLSWHFDAVDLPHGAQLLASTRSCAVQAYRLGAAQYGLQFHPEATLPLIELWIERFQHENGVDSRMDRVRAEMPRSLSAAQQFGRSMFDRWLAAVRAQR